jgi:pimeloyl-ACP methyl ester carboxylesterase
MCLQNYHQPYNMISKQKIVYLISGLGADESIFQNLDFKDAKPVFIKWIAPRVDDTLQTYAIRLSAQIETTHPIILGVSFGGMIAIEIAKYIDCQRVIIVSSAKTQYEIPFFYRFLGKLRLHRLIPITLFKQANLITYWFFGMQTNTERNLLKTILENTDSVFLKWAIHAILTWQHSTIINKLIHIHGNQDRILPIKNLQNVDFTIKNGGHLMIFNQATAVNTLFLQNTLFYVF